MRALPFAPVRLALPLAVLAALSGCYSTASVQRGETAVARKASAASRDAALRQLRQAIEQKMPWPDLQGKRDIAALSLALSPDFSGDRVAAFIYASADMLRTSHGGKTEVYLLDSLDTQHIYNAARNIEMAGSTCWPRC